jgi:hypothetical protein
MADMWTIVEEPIGEIYTNLLTLAPSRCSTFTFTRRYGLNFGQSAKLVTKSLADHLIGEVESKSWPGTTIEKGLGVVRKYRITPASIKVLAEAPGLYSWMHPKRPEDLSFYLPDNNIWLWSTAHEDESFIEDSTLSIEKIHKVVPGLQVRKR